MLLWNHYPFRRTLSPAMFTPLLIAMLCLAPPTPAPLANPAQVVNAASDIEFASLRAALAGLPRKDQNPADWAAAASTLRLNSRAFTARFPADPRGLELEASLSMGLEDDDAVDEAFTHLLRLAPKKTTAGLAWTDYWMARNEVHAFEVLESLIEKRPDALLYLDRLFRILAVENPQRLINRFRQLGAAGSDIDRCSHELDMLARVAGALAAAIGEQLRIAYPDNLGITVATARGYRHANKFGMARQLLDGLPTGHLVDPAHIYLWSDTYYADHHFEHAVLDFGAGGAGRVMAPPSLFSSIACGGASASQHLPRARRMRWTMWSWEGLDREACLERESDTLSVENSNNSRQLRRTI